MWDHHEGWGSGGMVVGIVLMTMLVALLVVGAVLLVRRERRTSTTVPLATPTARAEEVLAERLARGEIEVDEYRRTAAALRETP